MNLVEISEMLKGAPDTYLTQHIQTPDGSVPQYLALAELQRRQDMRARFAQQNPQSTVADDATQGIAAAAPGMAPPMAPPGAPPEAPPQGFAKGGEVKDTTLDQILYRLGIRNLPSEKSAYESNVKQAQRRLSASEAEAEDRMRQHARRMQQGMAAEEDAAMKAARNKMVADPVEAIMAERQRVSSMSPEQVLAMQKAEDMALADENMEWFLQQEMQNPEQFKLGPRIADKMARPKEGYKEGGLIEQYIQRAGKFESGNNRNAKNPFSSASGRFQFIDSTRRRLDKKYGFDPKDRSDETEAERMRVYTQETVDALESSNIPVTGGTLYGGHFLGQGGIKKFFDAYRKDPNANVSEHFSAEIIKKNPAIFNPRGGAPRTTLASVMEKFDKVGGGRQRTPMSDEDMNLGAAVQVASRADRGDIGPYEDMNMKQAAALAQLLEPSKLARTPAPALPYLQMQNSADQQMRSQMLEQLGIPSGMTGNVGFAGGGIVKGYSGADGVSSVGGFYIDMNGIMRDSVTGEPVSESISADLRPNTVNTMQDRVVPAPRPANLIPGSGAPVGNFYTDTSGSASPIAIVERNPITVIGGNAKRESPQGKNKPEKQKQRGGRKPDSEDYDIAKLLGKSGYEQMTTPAFGSAEEADLLTYPAQALAHGKNFIENFIPGAVKVPAEAAAGLAATGAGVVSDVFTLPAGELKRKWAAERAGSKSAPSQFFYTPESAASTGGSGILGGAGINLPPEVPAAPPSAEDVAAATQRLRDETGAAAPAAPVAPSVPATTPPASKFDTFADQFLQELRDAKMSKEEMRQNALLQAGLGMMAGTSPHFFTNVGQGAMAGLQSYQQSKAQNQALASEAYKNMMAARAFGLDELKTGFMGKQVEIEALKAERDAALKQKQIDLGWAELGERNRDALAKVGKDTGLKVEEVKGVYADVDKSVREKYDNLAYPGKKPTELEIQNEIYQRTVNVIRGSERIAGVAGAPGQQTIKMGAP